MSIQSKDLTFEKFQFPDQFVTKNSKNSNFKTLYLLTG